MKSGRFPIARVSRGQIIWSALILVMCLATGSYAAEKDRVFPVPPDLAALAPPVVEGRWIRPAATHPALSIWGHAHGIRVGLYPTDDPRGLLRIFAPYLDLGSGQVINFIAIEPIPKGKNVRGYSELEMSRLDGVRGKRLWSTDDPRNGIPRLPWEPVSGTITTVNGVEMLRVWIGVERFNNGAHVYLQLIFRADRPHEFGIATYAVSDSVPLDHCIVTATMGNFARLRKLQLAHRFVLAHDLWPVFAGDGFTAHAEFPLSDMLRSQSGDAVVNAMPNELHPETADYAPDTPDHWRYVGRLATQFWRCPDPDPALKVSVNGRRDYWASQSPIPGGIAFENFEMIAPFHQGEQFWFGVEPVPATASNTSHAATPKSEQ